MATKDHTATHSYNIVLNLKMALPLSSLVAALANCFKKWFITNTPNSNCLSIAQMNCSFNTSKQICYTHL